MSEKKVALSKIIDEFGLEPVKLPGNADNIFITSTEVSRPGLQLSGYYDQFDERRIQVIGNAESSFLQSLDEEMRRKRICDFMSRHPAAVIVSHDNDPDGFMTDCAEKHEVPLLATDDNTSSFVAALIAYLAVQLAPMVTRHGVFVEVYGEGVLILGDSGIGKSETAIELIKRGHRFIADDAVDLKKVSAKTIVGSAPDLIKYYIELRGIGVVDVRRIFGMGSVKQTEKVDLVITLEQWDEGKVYDRFGLESEFTEILGIKIPSLLIPVRPGRNLAIIIEIAAMNNRQKKMGYNTAEELNEKLMKLEEEAERVADSDLE